MFDHRFYVNRTIVALRTMFYVRTPSETACETFAEMPNYYADVLPMFIVAAVLEIVFILGARKNSEFLYGVNDYITSISTVLMQFLVGVQLYDVHKHAYVWVFENARIFTLPWASPAVWYGALLGVDFLYYAFHRMAHEMALLWAFHQAHHSSEHYNLSTAFRQHVFQAYTSAVFYFPLALLGFPPSIVLTHQILNLLFQVWIHTEFIGNLGPLEWVVNTPSHHRVHHGRNPYCIDKNYAGVLIVWDRLFGTFEAERNDDEVVYGLVTNVRSFNPLYLQFFALFDIVFGRFPKARTWRDRLKVLFFPPGWAPNHDNVVPEVHRPVVRYNPRMPGCQKIYIIFHFIVVFVVFLLSGLVDKSTAVSTSTLLEFSLFAILSFQCFGALFDAKSYGPLAELARCVLVLCVILWYDRSQILLFVVFAASALVWLPPVQRWLLAATVRR